MQPSNHIHRAALAALMVIILVALAGCSAISQGMARGAAAIAGPEAIQGKLGHVDGPLTYVKATETEIAHYEIAIDGTDGKVYNGIIKDAAIVADLIKKGVSKHDPVSFAGVELDEKNTSPPPKIAREEESDTANTRWTRHLDSLGVVYWLPPGEETYQASKNHDPIDIEITRFKLR